ncbi:MAG TPA: HAMP domain-containing sensor histidine kinase [Melioribacteraceae bacterium]|nr:HAMP domain-containing sensor histidine kinase [Melioribacteraceae bacterium]
MKINPKRKIGFLLVIIIIFPLLLFSAYQLYNLNEDAKNIQQIYDNQIETIIFSLNQYSEDFIGRKRAELENIFFFNTNNLTETNIKQFLDKNEFVKHVTVLDTSLNVINLYGNYTDSLKKFYTAFAKSNNLTFERLLRYKKSNYDKIEPIELNDSCITESFVLGINNNYKIVFLTLNIPKFISFVLDPKIRRSLSSNFFISIIDKNNKNEIYNSLNHKSNVIPEKFNAMWLFPNLKAGIELKGETIKELANKRTKYYLTIIAGLLIYVIGGIFYIFLSTGKELELVKMKTEFIANVSHELRTPLSLISMYAETLQLGRIKDESKKNEYINTIVKETSRLSKLVNSILNFSKAEAGKREFKLNEEELSDIVEETLDIYYKQLTQKGFTVNYTGADSFLPIFCDRESVKESLINILDNAVKYSGNSKTIDVTTEIDNNYCSVLIKDYGIGLTEEQQKKIFEKFYRVSSVEVHNTKGTGLGLSIVKQIMDYHKGLVTVNSKINEGSTFKLDFPIYKKENNYV